MHSLFFRARMRLLLIAAAFVVLAFPLASLASAGGFISLGPNDPIGADQLGVQVKLYTQPASGNPVFLGPTDLNNFILDTGASTILAAAGATSELTANPNFQTVATYNEKGVAGISPTGVSDSYTFYYAGSDGVLIPLPSTRILSTSDLDLQDIGGVAGMPLMVGRNTTADLTAIPTEGTSHITFSSTIPAGNGHRYDVPLQMVNFPLDGQQNPTDPLPTSAPLSMAPVQLHNGSHVVESHFLIDTGAQVSILSTAVAKALGINPATDVLEYLPVEGVGGTVQMPMVAADSIALHTTQGTDLKWSGLEVGVLDVDPQIAGVIGMDLLSTGWLNAFLGGGNGSLSELNFDFRNSANLTGDMLIDVDPGHDVLSHDGFWDFSSSGSYSDTAKWNSGIAASGAGLSVTFGNGVQNTVNASSVTVTVDGAETAGYLVFNNTNGTGYILGNDGVSGHGIMLDNGGIGANVSVAAGVTALQQIQAKLVLADDATFDIAQGSSLLISVGGIGETGGSQTVHRSITLTGGGTLTIAAPSSYTGTTTVNAGTLAFTGAGTIGTGPLAINADDGIASAVSFGSSQSLPSLTVVTNGTGLAGVGVASGATVSIPSGTTSIQGTFRKTDSGTFAISGSSALADGSALLITGGTLRFNITSGSATIGSGVTANVSGTSTLELAGSVSALGTSTAANRTNITTSSTTATLLVSGGKQQVGGIDGVGITQVNAGASLTANHIVQGALLIGGTSTSAALVTIDPSDASGNPLAQPGFALAGSLHSEAPFAAGTSSTQSALGTTELPIGIDGIFLGNGHSAGVASVVPEPTSAALCLLGLIAVAAYWRIGLTPRSIA
jgi:autotransporter-associated beta strand protein